MTSAPRLKMWLGLAATVVSSIASIATYSVPDDRSLSLPDEIVTLGPTAPEVRQRFRVETDNGKFVLAVRFDSAQGAAPSLQVLAVDAVNGLVEIASAGATPLDSRVAVLRTHIEMACLSKFPCVATYEVVAAADLTVPEPVTGTLSTSVEFDSGFHDNSYLAIEPL